MMSDAKHWKLWVCHPIASADGFEAIISCGNKRRIILGKSFEDATERAYEEIERLESEERLIPPRGFRSSSKRGPRDAVGKSLTWLDWMGRGGTFSSSDGPLMAGEIWIVPDTRRKVK